MGGLSSTSAQAENGVVVDSHDQTPPATGSGRALPRIIFIRHGEALHNVAPFDKTGLDPCLTQLGEEQARSLSTTYPGLFARLAGSPSSTLLVSSPFRRTLQTTLFAFSPYLSPSPVPPPLLPLILLPQLQEVNANLCDTGASLASTKPLFPDWIDWTTVESEEPDWNTNGGLYAAVEEQQLARAKWVREWIRDREEEVVIVVSHHGFLRRVCGLPAMVGVTQWDNGEAREYMFADPTDPS